MVHFVEINSIFPQFFSNLDVTQLSWSYLLHKISFLKEIRA